MFTGIIETPGVVREIRKEGSNYHFTLSCSFVNELKTDQSLAHNGVCLTVTKVNKDNYEVTAIEETLQRTNLRFLKINDVVNLERCMPANGRFDGHLVQGHIDQIATCKSIENKNGSWLFTFLYDASKGNITVEKGSVCVNGVSLTVVQSGEGFFSVAIIPYTFENTNFSSLKEGDTVNIEFDILGKYIAAYMNKTRF